MMSSGFSFFHQSFEVVRWFVSTQFWTEKRCDLRQGYDEDASYLHNVRFPLSASSFMAQERGEVTAKCIHRKWDAALALVLQDDNTHSHILTGPDLTVLAAFWGKARSGPPKSVGDVYSKEGIKLYSTLTLSIYIGLFQKILRALLSFRNISTQRHCFDSRLECRQLGNSYPQIRPSQRYGLAIATDVPASWTTSCSASSKILVCTVRAIKS